MEIYENDFETLEQAVSKGELDCCFTVHSEEKNIEFILLIKDKLFCIVSNQNPLSKQEIMYVEDLEKLRLIKPKKGWDHEIP